MSPPARAEIATLAFIRMTSASMPSSLKKPLLTAKPDGKKLMLKLVTEMRILSAAADRSKTAQTNPIMAAAAQINFLIERRNLSLAVFLRRFEDGLRNGAVGAATANVAAEPFGNLLAGGIGIFHQQRLGSHDLSRCAVTALGADVADESFLQRIQLIAARHAFDGEDGFLMRLESKVAARAHRPVVDQYRASAAHL